jgi:hypothetical protein
MSAHREFLVSVDTSRKEANRQIGLVTPPLVSHASRWRARSSQLAPP